MEDSNSLTRDQNSDGLRRDATVRAYALDLANLRLRYMKYLKIDDICGRRMSMWVSVESAAAEIIDVQLTEHQVQIEAESAQAHLDHTAHTLLHRVPHFAPSQPEETRAAYEKATNEPVHHFPAARRVNERNNRSSDRGMSNLVEDRGPDRRVGEQTIEAHNGVRRWKME